MKIMYRDKDRDIGKVQMYTGASMWLNSYFVLATQPCMSLNRVRFASARRHMCLWLCTRVVKSLLVCSFKLTY